jgi:hypothetical protein
MVDKADLYEQVKDAIEVLKLKLSRIEKTVEKFDTLTIEKDKQRQLAYLDKEITSSKQQLESINYDVKQCSKKKREALKSK